MKLLVTGGAGYIGSVVAHQLVEGFDGVLHFAALVGESVEHPEKPELEAMISDAWNWMRTHPNGYE